MIRIETPKSHMVFEIYTSAKEIIHNVVYSYKESDGCAGGDYLYIEYKDDSYYLVSDGYEEGSFKRTGIRTIIESNSSTYSLYGQYRIYNLDDTKETYCEDLDDVSKTWGVDVA